MRLLSVVEGILFEHLQSSLPEEWLVSLQDKPGVEWVAFIYQATDRNTMPLFTVCRWRSYLGLFVRWTDGTNSIVVHTELCSILDIIANAAFEMKGAHLATVPILGWADIKH